MSEKRQSLRDKLINWGFSRSYRLSQSKLGGHLLNILLTTAPGLLPLPTLIDTDSLIALHHPLPSYPVHILILPKKPYRNLLELPPEDSSLLTELVRTIQELIRDFNLESTNYRVIVNGGNAQDINHLHFHLVGDPND